MISNGPEKKDTNFTIEDFENVHNSEIVNKFGNLVNRTLKFKGLTNIPEGNMDKEIEETIINTYSETSKDIESLEFKAYVQKVMNLVETANKYYDSNEPWKAAKEDTARFNDIIYTCSTIISNLAVLFEPIMPEACHKLLKYMEIDKPVWEYHLAKAGIDTTNVEPLFERYK